MHCAVNRRDFLAATAAGAGLLAAGRLPAAPFRTKLQKALIGVPNAETFEQWKAAGFEGMEVGQAGKLAPPEEAAKGRELADKFGMKIHAVMFGWANFNQADQLEADLAAMRTSLQAARAYGADAVLLVPCRIGGMTMPEPWEFDIDFDEKTNHVRRVVQGDNAKYAKYIEAHNHAIDTAREAVKKLIPAAEKTGVRITLENVWNNLWVQPAIFAHFVKSFDSPWVQAYFDIGNHVKYAPPQEWIRALGTLIVKCHVKDFKIDRQKRMGGEFVRPRDGDVDWPAVRRELDKLGYHGWLTIEDDGLSLDEYSRRLDLIIAGK
jgi:hexulose-6-phosphate isomerase